MNIRHFISLQRRIEDAGLSNKELSLLIGVSDGTMRSRLKCMESAPEWRGSEIVAICKIVGIPRSEICELFFPTVEGGESA